MLFIVSGAKWALWPRGREGEFGLLLACVEPSSSGLMASFPLSLLLSPSLALSLCISRSFSLSLFPSLTSWHPFAISLVHHLPPICARFILCKQILCLWTFGLYSADWRDLDTAAVCTGLCSHTVTCDQLVTGKACRAQRSPSMLLDFRPNCTHGTDHWKLSSTKSWHKMFDQILIYL